MSSQHPPIVQIFWIFFITGLLTFGGGYGMIPILQHDFVVTRQWMTIAQYKDAVAVGLVSPGPVAILATFIGYRLNAWLGAIAATIGVFTPSIIMVYLASKFFGKFEKSNIALIALPIINSAVIGLLGGAVVSLGKLSVDSYFTLFLAIASFVFATWTKISPIWVIIVCGLIGLFFL
jgi:chromate transporter